MKWRTNKTWDKFRVPLTNIFNHNHTIIVSLLYKILHPLFPLTHTHTHTRTHTHTPHNLTVNIAHWQCCEQLWLVAKYFLFWPLFIFLSVLLQANMKQGHSFKLLADGSLFQLQLRLQSKSKNNFFNDFKTTNSRSRKKFTVSEVFIFFCLLLWFYFSFH